MVTPSTPEKPPRRALSEYLRLALAWAIQYCRELMNLRFDRYMIMQVLPGVYGILLVAIVITIILGCIITYLINPWLGLLSLLLSPLSFLIAATVLRGFLEFYAVVFRIAENVDELVGLRDTVDRLSGISDSVDEMVSVTRRLPFWSLITKRRTNPTATNKNTNQDPR